MIKFLVKVEKEWPSRPNNSKEGKLMEVPGFNWF